MISSHWTVTLLVLSYVAHSSTGFASIGPQKKPRSSTTSRSTLPRTTATTTRLPYQTGSQIDLELPKDILFPSRHHDAGKGIGLVTLPTEQSEEYSRPPTPMDLHIVRESKTGSNDFPLILTPTSERQQSKLFLQLFLLNNERWISDQIKDYGAVIFRGFDVSSATDVEDTILSYNPNLSNVYRGTSPRNALDGSRYVFSAAEVPSHWPIAQHIEMSFLPSPPKQLFFSALQAPKTVGGETALADFRKVYQDVPIQLREKLAAKKIRYRRTHPMKIADGDSIRRTHDVASHQTWPSVFGTSDKREVERIAKMENPNALVRWEGPDGNIFVSEFESEPFRIHPETGEMVWFNHVNVFHWTSFAAELVHSYRRTKDVRFLFHAIRVGAKSLLEYGIFRRKMGLHIEYGDGTPISFWEMHLIRKAIHKNMVFNRWQQGDLLFIDNLSTSHGRQPTYGSGRKIAVAWSE